MDSSDNGFTRILNLMFILDNTDNISDEDYSAACDFLNTFKESMTVDGMDAEVRIVVAPTGGEIVGPVPLSDFKWESKERSASDLPSLFSGIPELLRSIEHLGSSYVVDNVIIYLSNGKFVEAYPRPYIDICRNWRYTRTPKFIITFGDDKDVRKLADIVGTDKRVFGKEIFEEIKFYVMETAVEFHKIHGAVEIPTIYADRTAVLKVNRKAEEHEPPVSDVYDI